MQEFAQVFRPHTCELQPLDAEHFNQCLQGKRVIMIGDSTMRQMFQSLACILGEHIQDGFLQVSMAPSGPRSAISSCATLRAVLQQCL